MMLESTRLRTRPARRTPEGHMHAKRVLLLKMEVLNEGDSVARVARCG